jgi:hypothetical protein
MGGTYRTCEEKRSTYKILLENLMERVLFKDLGLNGRIILKCIFEK